MSGTVLVVDDEPNIRDLIETALRFHGFDVTTAETGDGALARIREDPPDLIVLDVMLPDQDGFDLCRGLRAGGDQTPIIFLTARDAASDTVTGLTLGGDDYVTKPFSIDTVVARVRAVLRRARAAAAPQDGGGAPDDDAVLKVGDLELDEARWTVRRGGTQVELSPTEFRLLAYLMRNPERVLSRGQILEHVWGWGQSGSAQVVETYIGYLRRKLDPLGPPLIRTQRGVGYALEPPA